MTRLLVSGAIAVGKSEAAGLLARRLHGSVLQVRQALTIALGVDARDRATLQRLGADLDRRTNGTWLRDFIVEHATGGQTVVVDALRTRRQTVPILENDVDSRLIYLDAHEETRRRRYHLAAASDPIKAGVSFDVAMHHPTELEVANLRPMAHVIVETDDLTPHDVVEAIVRALALD